ncbi:DUF4179 domain-containing protein [Paenibacillus sp. Marseille-Q4541]|uniref:DUF4179 domain-containing protein n=1 Tax=Paenibacillus sp. Marseille-Q4541 TaxID=2831522 RepID=UPI001BA4EC6F|nr:DUF4179 domain-containing protein [Paenibacillus sp. Marseille-Q4541]
MLDKEERILTQDAQKVKENSEQVREMKLNSAVRIGIEKGRKRQRIITYGGGAFIAAVVAVLIFLSSDVLLNTGPNTYSGQPVTTKSWSDSNAFSTNKSLENVLNNNLIQPVYQSVEKNGYRLEVLGAVTDSRKLYVLYSVRNNSDQEVTQADPNYYYGGVEVSGGLGLGASVELAQSGNNIIYPGDTKNFIYTTNLTPSTATSKEARYEITIGEGRKQTELKVAFELDSTMFQSQIRTVNTDRTMTIDGQQIHVKQVVYTPLHTYVDLEYDPENTKHIFQLVGPVLISKTGDQKEKLYYPSILTSDNSDIYTDKLKTTLVFNSSTLDRIDSIALHASGISALTEDQMKVVVDIQKKEIIQAPDNDLKIIKPTEPVELGEFLFQREIKKMEFMKSTAMWLDTQFQDASGVSHDEKPLVSTHIGSSFSRSLKEDSGLSEEAYNFGTEALNYPQPLTIKIEKYWNPILDKQTLELLSED